MFDVSAAGCFLHSAADTFMSCYLLVPAGCLLVMQSNYDRAQTMQHAQPDIQPLMAEKSQCVDHLL